jgi:hypothetical protein
MDIHETWYEYHANAGHPTCIFQFHTANTVMANFRTYEVGATLASLNMGSRMFAEKCNATSVKVIFVEYEASHSGCAIFATLFSFLFDCDN